MFPISPVHRRYLSRANYRKELGSGLETKRLSSSFYYTNRVVKRDFSVPFSWSKVVFLPQNHKSVSHLDLASDLYYLRYFAGSGVKYDRNKERDIYCGFIEDTSMGSIKKYVLSSMFKPCIGAFVSRIVRNFLRFTQITKCVRYDECITVTRQCLNALYLQRSTNCEVVVDVLVTLCSASQLYVEDLFSEFYSLDFFRYILTSCVNARFSFKTWILNHPCRGIGLLAPPCPVLNHILGGNFDFVKLLIEFGFERYEPHMTVENSWYEFVKVTQILRYMGVNVKMQRYENCDEYLQRPFLVVETLFMICASMMGQVTESWVECAELIHKSIPDAPICEMELYALLNSTSNLEQISRIIDMCQTRFKKVVVPMPEPKSLKCLSRCAFRKVLVRSFLLPYGVRNLGLPRQIVDYVTFDPRVD